MLLALSKTKYAPQSAFPGIGGPRLVTQVGRPGGRAGWGQRAWAHTPVSLLRGPGKVWQRGAQSCHLPGPQPAQDRASQRGRGWRFSWKASPVWLRALRGWSGGDTNLKPAKVWRGVRPGDAP